MKYRSNAKIKFTTYNCIKKVLTVSIQYTIYPKQLICIPGGYKVWCYAVMFTHDIRAVVDAL
jgi:hypothetical protein